MKKRMKKMIALIAAVLLMMPQTAFAAVVADVCEYVIFGIFTKNFLRITIFSLSLHYQNEKIGRSEGLDGQIGLRAW